MTCSGYLIVILAVDYLQIHKTNLFLLKPNWHSETVITELKLNTIFCPKKHSWWKQRILEVSVCAVEKNVGVFVCIVLEYLKEKS